MSDLPKRSVRIIDLTRIDTDVKIDEKQELLFPVASNQSEKDTFAMPLNSFVSWLLLKHAANRDLSNLSDIGQGILDAKQDYFNKNADDSDFNRFVEDGIYKVRVSGNVEVHAPTSATGFYVVVTDTDNNGVIEQQARNLYINSGNIYHRQRINGTWTGWGLITQDMTSPTFTESPTVLNPGTRDDQLATIGQLNGKFADIFKTENYLTEGLLVNGTVDYDSGIVTLHSGAEYITNDSNKITLSEDKTLNVPASGTHYVFADVSGEVVSWSAFEKVAEFPTNLVAGTLYYNVMTDTYMDSENTYSLAPLGTVRDGDFTQKAGIEFLNVENLQAVLDALGVQMKVDQMIGDKNQNSVVTSDTEFERSMSAGHYDGSEDTEYSMTYGAEVSVTSHEESESGVYSKSVTAHMFAKDGSDETEIRITPDSAILKTTRLDEASPIATLSDLEDIMQTSLTFIGYVSASEPSSSDYTFKRGNLWINGSVMPETLPVPASNIKEWSGTAWVAHADAYNPKDFDFFRNVNDNEGYYWFGGDWKVMSTDMDTDYFELGTDGKWKIKESINLPGAPTTTTPATSDNSNKIATTQFVQSALGAAQKSLTPGEGITISENDVISANRATVGSLGIIKGSDLYAVSVDAGGAIFAQTRTAEQYETSTNNNAFISRGTLENIKTNLVTSIGDTKYQGKLIAGENITIDEATNTISATGGSSGSGRNVGDIFFTSRLDESLSGAVECNGGMYNTSDYEGSGSIGELLRSGKLPYVSLSQYSSLLSANGSVGVFGWDGNESGTWYAWSDFFTAGGTVYTNTLTNPDTAYDENHEILDDITFSDDEIITTRHFGTFERDVNKDVTSGTFRVPTLRDVFVESGQAAQLGNYISAGLPNITGVLNRVIMYNGTSGTGAFRVGGSAGTTPGPNSGGPTQREITLDASRSSSIYGNSDTVQPKAIKYRAMVQLFNSAADEAVATVGTVVAQVGELNSHRVVDFQIPTAANGYTWYRKYADGWVEQGGKITNSGNSTYSSITLPVEMKNTEYTVSVAQQSNSTSAPNTTFVGYKNISTTQVLIGNRGYNNEYALTQSWQVSGMVK